MSYTLERLRDEALLAAESVGFGPAEIDRACISHFDTSFGNLSAEELRKFRDQLRELKHSETRPITRTWDRRDSGEARARQAIAADIRKRDGIVMGRDPLGRKVSDDHVPDVPEPAANRRPPA